MGWVCEKEPKTGGFMLRDTETASMTEARVILFRDEADSHAAGEAVRSFLGQPRFSEVVAAKDKAEADLAEFKARSGVSLAAAEKRAEAVEAPVAAAARVELARAFEAERKALHAERDELRAEVTKHAVRIAELEEQVKSLPAPAPTVVLEARIQELEEATKDAALERAASDP